MGFQPFTGEFFSTQRVDKPWGHETLWAFSETYVGKILHVNAGESLSLQYHVQKDETLTILSGRVLLEQGPHEDDLSPLVLEPGHSFRVRPGTRHRMVAETDADILEASTPELDDVVRLSDRYGREGTSEA